MADAQHEQQEVDVLHNADNPVDLLAMCCPASCQMDTCIVFTYIHFTLNFKWIMQKVLQSLYIHKSGK